MVYRQNSAVRIRLDNYLEHHGIKGQRWGIRRFQNEDGTLTADGKIRYGKSSSEKQAVMPQRHWGIRTIREQASMPTRARNEAIYQQLSQQQRKQYDKMSSGTQKRLMKKLSQGKSMTKSMGEIHKENKRLAINFAVGSTATVIGLGVGTGLLSAWLKRKASVAIRQAASTNTGQRVLLNVGKLIKRHSMKKAGAIVLNKKRLSNLWECAWCIGFQLSLLSKVNSKWRISHE